MYDNQNNAKEIANEYSFEHIQNLKELKSKIENKLPKNKRYEKQLNKEKKKVLRLQSTKDKMERTVNDIKRHHQLHSLVSYYK